MKLYRCCQKIYFCGLGLFPLLLFIPEGGRAAQEARITSSSVNYLSFEIVVPQPEIVPADGGDGVWVHLMGYGSFSPPGAPEIPGKTFRVAIPPRGEPRVEFVVLEDELLGPLPLARVWGERFIKGEGGIPTTERYYPRDPWADTGMPQVVSAGKPSFMGRQRVLPVRVNPLVLGDGGARLVRRLSVTVHFEGWSPDREIEPSRDLPPSGAWKRLYDDLLLNPGDVARFRRPLLPRRVELRGYQEETNRLKLLVPETGIYSIRADSLIESGLSPGLSTDGFGLKKLYYDEGELEPVRQVDIPIHVIEDGSSTNGIFDGGDVLIFYALGIKDDVDAGDIDAMYTDDNVVWIEEEVAGKYMEEGPPLPSGGGAPLSCYRAFCKVRKDSYYLKHSVPGTRDFNFMKGPVSGDASIPFVAHSPDGSGLFSLSVRIQGFDDDNVQDLSFAVGTNIIGTGSISPKEDRTFTFDNKPCGWLVDGENTLVISGGVEWGFLVNDFTVDYTALFVAHENVIEFQAGMYIGVRTIEITGFTVDKGVLIEITDPSNPLVYSLSSDYFISDTLTLNIEAPTKRRFIVLGAGAGGRIANSRILSDTPSHLMESRGPFNTLIISHSDFLPASSVEFAGYVERRIGEGYRVLTADVEDVYDEFNGGLPSCEAIRRFIRYGCENWGVEYVLLVGDGNEDHKALFDKTPPDFIPPYTYCNRVMGDFKDEVVATDRYYTFLDEAPPLESGAGTQGMESRGSAGDGQPDPLSMQEHGYPDVFLGRFPVSKSRDGKNVELRALLAKIGWFEQPTMEDSWRRRIILFADDAWSGYPDYRYNISERRFESSMRMVEGSIDLALPGGFNIRELYLSRWTDGSHENTSEHGPDVFAESKDSTRAYFTPYLVDRLNEGCLYFVFQGHGNRSQMCSEYGFSSRNQFKDLDKLEPSFSNIFIGIGCHLSEFALVEELAQATIHGPNGDCLSEQFLFKAGAGSVGAYASSAFEYLTDNARLCETLHEVVFQSPPADSVPPEKECTGAHWVLGEVLAKAEIEHIDLTYYGYTQLFRYILLGDPMLSVDPGPPLMLLEADWGDGWVEMTPDSMFARNGTNECVLRLTVSDIVALGAISFELNGVDQTDSLDIVPLKDQDKTFARAYTAEMDYTISLDDESLLFSVLRPDGREAGIREYTVETRMRLFVNGMEITPAVEAPHDGDFLLLVDLPAYISQEPILMLDGRRVDGANFTTEDSLHWEGSFTASMPAGERVLTLRVGEFYKDFIFTVTGDELVVDAFNFPNPFREGTNIAYTLNLPVDFGRIDIFNVSGRLIRILKIPRDKLGAANFPAPHSIYWDGRDLAGDTVANGTYIYMIRIDRNGESITINGKSVKLE